MGESASASEQSVGKPATTSEQSRNNDDNQMVENTSKRMEQFNAATVAGTLEICLAEVRI